MSIVKSTNKKTGITYVYESESYWDPQLKQPRNHRKLIGKLDDAGNIVPTGKPGRKRKEDTSGNGKDLEELLKASSYYEERWRQAETQVVLLQKQVKKLEKEKETILSCLEDILKKYPNNTGGSTMG